MNQFTPLLKDMELLLKKTNWQLVTAESCTGGLIASYITDIPGSSAWFERGFVTYSNLAKQEMLAVSPDLITRFGAVSKEVAAAMVTGALQHSVGNVAVSVTGIAGPDGGSVEKPVGTVCFAWGIRNQQPLTLKKQFGGDRQEIRSAACEQALLGILSLLHKEINLF